MNERLNTTRLFQLILILLLLVWCFMIIQPFVLLLVWAIILAVALFPLYQKLAGRHSGGRRKRATFLFTLVIALIIFVPAYYLISAGVRGTRTIVQHLEEESFHVPRPDPAVAEWPVVGERTYAEWKALADNTHQYVLDHREMLLEKGGSLLGSIGGFIGSLLVLIISFFIAVAFMYNADKGYQTAQLFLKKMVGANADDIIRISRDTIRGVVKGILLVALIQALLALIGFEVAGIPLAGVFAFLVLIFAVVQLPVLLVLIPPVLIGFSTLETGAAIFLTVYLLAVSLIESILKPILMGMGL